MASYWRYNGNSYPALPDWVKDYAYITLHDPNLGDTYIVATNDIEVRKSNNITYGVWHDTFAIGAVVSARNIDSWREPITGEERWLGGQSPYMDHSYRARWSNVDLPCAEDDGTEYVILAGSNPIDKETGEEIQLTPSIEPDKPPEETVTSAPAPDPTSMLMGWLVGRAIAGQRGVPYPVAYLYNGVRLPKLPEWDREMYPYAYISDMYPDSENLAQKSRFILTFANPKAYWTVSGGRYRLRTDEKLQYVYDHESGAWVLDIYGWAIAVRYLDEDTYVSSLIWADTDTYNFDGTAIYVAKSEPVPVYA